MIGAVVVLYNPDLAITSQLLEGLVEQVNKIVIIDNSPLSTALDYNQFGITKADYYHYPNNIGLAKAHNIGLVKVAESGCKYGIIFDQDSLISDGFIDGLVATLESGFDSHNVIAVGPQVWCSFDDTDVRPRVQKRESLAPNLDCASQIISSGMMIHLPSYMTVGPKDERLFIDGVDHEWCWRANSKGYRVGIATHIIMPHRLGDERQSRLGISYKVGSPIRLYYQFRNILLLAGRGYVPTYWKIRNLCLMPLKLVVQSITHDDGKQRFTYMIRGIRDGILRRTGKISKN